MDETHELLLALAGHVDDDLLAWARELVAVGEDTRAVELVTAGLCADRVALPPAVRAATVEAAKVARIDLDADTALPPATTDDPDIGHRFTARHSDDRVTAAIGALPARLLDGARVRLVWRLTPAGAAPGPLPHPVLLVDVEPGGRPADVLAYQLYAGLDRSGVVASVEVLTSDRPLSAYHAAARREAHPVGAEPRDEVPEPHPLPRPVRSEPGEPAIAVPAFLDEHTGQVPATPPPRALPLRPASDGGGRRRRSSPEPAPGAAQRAGEPRRPVVTPIGRALPSPVPLLRRDGAPQRPLGPVEPRGAATDQQSAVRPAAEGQGAVPADPPTFRSMQDPLSGPLNVPLLGPLLDPRPPGDEYESREFDGTALGGHGGVSPLAPDAEATAEDGWAGEWVSGDWAVASTNTDTGEPDDLPETPVVAPGDAPRHRYNEPPSVQLLRPPAAQHQPPAPQPDPNRSDFGLRSESLARLSDADRELLARLQAELGASRKPRMTRRTDVAPNGNGRPNQN